MGKSRETRGDKGNRKKPQRENILGKRGEEGGKSKEVEAPGK